MRSTSGRHALRGGAGWDEPGTSLHRAAPQRGAVPRVTIEYAPLMSKAPSHQIFIASPGDLTNERACVVACINEVNLSHLGTDLPDFVGVGWEESVGTARRPQEVINEELRRCDYMIVLLKEQWGSPPGAGWGYTSGTEEELFTGLLGLQDRDALIRDVWLVFMAAPSPAPEITALKEQLNRRHALYYDVVDGIDQLAEKVRRRLERWVSDPVSKTTRTLELTPSTGRDVLRVHAMRRDGLLLADLGFTEQAKDKLQAAATSGDPRAMLDFARFLFREGDLVNAEIWNKKVVELGARPDGVLYTPAVAKAFSNLGLIERNRGNSTGAIARHKSALNLIAGTDRWSVEIQADVLDALGLALQDAGDFAEANNSFTQSLDLRRRNNDRMGIAQSEVNIARRLMNDGHVDEAQDHCELALDQIEGSTPSPLLANAVTLRAQLHAARDRHTDAIDQAQVALELNRQLANRRGQCVVLNVMAQSQIKRGLNDDAAASAAECLRINEEIGSRSGQAAAHHLLGLVAASRGDWTAVCSELRTEIALRKQHRPNRTQIAWCHVLYAQALRETGDLDAARTALNEANEFAPTSNAALQDAIRSEALLN